MFNFLDDLSVTYTWPVAFNLPASGGKVTAIKFHAEFNRLTAEREKELTDEVNARVKKILKSAKDQVGGDADAAADDDDMTQVNLYIRDQVLVGVGEFDSSGKSYTAADADKEAQLLSVRGATEAILVAYGKSKSGEKAKN